MRFHKSLTPDLSQRLLVVFVWAALMLTALLVTTRFDLRKTIWFPLLFLPLMIPVVFLPFKMSENTKARTRFWRFALWAYLMMVASIVTNQIEPQRTLFIPILFLPLMVPIILMPLGRAKKTI